MDCRNKEEIEIDFYRAIAKAQELEDIANELSRIAGAQAEGSASVLRNSWRGENGEKMAQKVELISGNMYETADDIIKIAKNIRSTADIVYRAEKMAAGFFG